MGLWISSRRSRTRLNKNITSPKFLISAILPQSNGKNWPLKYKKSTTVFTTKIWKSSKRNHSWMERKLRMENIQCKVNNLMASPIGIMWKWSDLYPRIRKQTTLKVMMSQVRPQILPPVMIRVIPIKIILSHQTLSNQLNLKRSLGKFNQHRKVRKLWITKAPKNSSE